MDPAAPDDPIDLDAWSDALESRHLRDLTFPEVRRALQALSSLYVERRGRLRRGAALDGAGKRAAFALFYGPLHFTVASRVVRELGLANPAPEEVVDLGCGTGAVGAAFALAAGAPAVVRGIDLNPWALEEARRTYRDLDVRGSTARGRIERTRLVGSATRAIACGWVVNELDDAARDTLLDRLLEASEGGTRVLVLEPIARRVTPWWNRWREAFEARGGRGDDWSFEARLPPIAARLARAAGLDQRRSTARSLALGAADGARDGAP